MTGPTHEPTAAGDEARAAEEPTLPRQNNEDDTTRPRQTIEDLEPVEDRTGDLPPPRTDK